MTAYYPNESNLENAKKISGQSDLLIICDNSPVAHKKLFSNIKNAKYFFWGKNLGLSAAFNYVLKNKDLDWLDDDYVIFFDQDSTIPMHHIDMLVREYELLIMQGERVGCIGPVYFDLSSSKEEIPRLKSFVNKNSMKVSSIITTSMLCQYKSLREIDFWNEKVFLDMADWDICWRFEEKKMNVYLTYASVIRHILGQGVKKVGPFKLHIGKPFREYYQTRECLYFLFKDYVPYKYKCRFLLMLTVRPILHILFLNNKTERFRYIGKGIIDFILKKKGSL